MCFRCEKNKLFVCMERPPSSKAHWKILAEMAVASPGDVANGQRDRGKNVLVNADKKYANFLFGAGKIGRGSILRDSQVIIQRYHGFAFV